MLQRQDLEDPQGDPRRVLLVTADVSVRGLVSTFLWSMGCSCVIAANGADLANVEHATFDAVLIDAADSWTNPEQAVARIIELHPSLAKRILVLNGGVTNPELLKLVERHGLRQMSHENLLQQVWATLQEIFSSPGMAKRTPRKKQITQLIFDRLRAPLPDGVHSLRATGRHLAYNHKDAIIDIVLEPKQQSGRVSLVGQVVGAEIINDGNGALSVALTDGMKTLARTKTDKFGKFKLEFDLVEDAAIQIRLGQGSGATIPLGKMDWVKRQFPACQHKH
jgi:hypothetical protein